MSVWKQNKRKKIGLLALTVPTGVIIAASLFPLRPMIQQMLVGVMLIWLYVAAIVGFNI